MDLVGRAGDHLFLVDQRQTRDIDGKDLELPFGARSVSDIVNRAETAMPQAQTLAMELVLKPRASGRPTRSRNASIWTIHKRPTRKNRLLTSKLTDEAFPPLSVDCPGLNSQRDRTAAAGR